MAYKRMLGKRRRDETSGRPAKRFRRNMRRKRRQRKGRVYNKIMRQPVPDKIMTKLMYSEVLALSLSGLTVGYYQFRNSIFDPDVTSTGHQPMWRDQLVNLYNRYRVHGIKYRFTIVNTNTSQLLSGVIKHSSDGVLETNLNSLRERRSTRKWVAGPSSTRPTVVKGFMHCGKPHGMTKRDFLADEDFEAAMTANPVKQTYLEFYALTQNTSAAVHVQCDLVFYTELLDRVSVGGS